MPIEQTETEESVDGTTTIIRNPPKIGWSVNNGNISAACQNAQENDRGLCQRSLAEVQLTHKEITDRFVELLDLFENYTKIVSSNRKNERGIIEASGLKRAQSEQLVQKEEPSDLTKSSTSLMQLSDCTLVGNSKPITSEISCQTSWTLLEQNFMKAKAKKEASVGSKILNQSKPSKLQQHTIHIEVESVSSSTALQRAPLRQRVRHIVMQAGEALMASTFMIGENFTYILFVILCIWCLYLVIGHYYSFLHDNVNRPVPSTINVNQNPPYQLT